MSWGAPGFAHATTSKLFASVSVMASLAATAGRAGLPPPDLGMNKPELWRLISSNLAFTSAGELVFGFGLLYYFRTVERNFGTGKYTAYAFVVSTVAAILQLVISKAVMASPTRLASGPYPLIFAGMLHFARDIPSTSRFAIGPSQLHISLTDKSFVYGTALQLALSRGVQSAVPALSGVIAGLLYRANVARLGDFRFPGWLCRLAERGVEKLAPFVGVEGDDEEGAGGGARQRRDAAHEGGEGVGAGAWGAGREGQPNLARAAPTATMRGGAGAGFGQPSQEAIEMLVSMGFDRQEATTALQMGGNNLNEAMEILLNGPGGDGRDN